MSITDELREWAEGDTLRAGMSLRMAHDQALAIADRIDAEADDNERFRRDVEPFCDRLREAAAERADVTMYGVDYVALPVDADGKPIHFGDVLDQFGTPMTVIAMSDPDPDEGDCMLRLTIDGIDDTWVRARKMHHHKPTVEDVLREFADRVLEWAGKSGTVAETGTWSDVAAEYIAKLRLADDGEEQ